MVVVPGPAWVRRPVVDIVPTSGFEFCHAATLVRSRSVSEKRPVAIIWMRCGCPSGREAGPIATETDESVGDDATVGVDCEAPIGVDWLQAQLERSPQIAAVRRRDVTWPPVTDCA